MRKKREKKEMTTFTMRMPLEIHNFLEKYANDSFTSMSNIILQLIIIFKKEELSDDE